jgi:hypothetical protein
LLPRATWWPRKHHQGWQQLRPRFYVWLKCGLPRNCWRLQMQNREGFNWDNWPSTAGYRPTTSRASARKGIYEPLQSVSATRSWLCLRRPRQARTMPSPNVPKSWLLPEPARLTLFWLPNSAVGVGARKTSSRRLDDLHGWKVSVLAQTGLSFDLSTSSGPYVKGRFKDDEADARGLRAGLWDGCFVAPQDFRYWQKSHAPLLGMACTPDARDKLFPNDPRMPPGCPIKGKLAYRAWPFHIGIYHTEGCGSYQRTKHPQRWFCTEGEAQEAGFRKSLPQRRTVVGSLMRQTGGTAGDRWSWSITCVLIDPEESPRIGWATTREEAPATVCRGMASLAGPNRAQRNLTETLSCAPFWISLRPV